MASDEEAPKAKQPNQGKSYHILALGKAFPQQLVIQDHLVHGYFKRHQLRRSGAEAEGVPAVYIPNPTPHTTLNCTPCSSPPSSPSSTKSHAAL